MVLGQLVKFVQNSYIILNKRSNILYKSSGGHNARILRYVSPYFNLMHERVEDNRMT